jgi:hypothetical protein
VELQLSSKALLVLFLFGIVVVTAVFYPVHKKQESLSGVESASPIEDSNESVSNLFNLEDRKDKEEFQPIPTDIPKDKACNLDGQVVREGTVSSNTICVNETPSVTPKI